MSRAERFALPQLPIEVNPTDRITTERPGQNPTRKIDKYRAEEAVSREGLTRTNRTDRAAHFILEAARLSGGVAPYAFTLPNGDPSSLDWWIISVLKNQGEVEFQIGAAGFVTGVRPTQRMLKRYGHASAPVADSVEQDVEAIATNSTLTPTERLAEVMCRIGQGEFRRQLMERFGSRCVVTGCEIPQLLRASHIVAWAADPSLRRDADNGLLLCAHIDAAFDAHLVSFEDSGHMKFSRRLPEAVAAGLGIHGRLRCVLSDRTKAHLKRHRSRLAELDRAA